MTQSWLLFLDAVLAAFLLVLLTGITMLAHRVELGPKFLKTFDNIHHGAFFTNYIVVALRGLLRLIRLAKDA